MVKKFRRAAAGLEEQLPSNLRPPTVLKRTCDYLFNDVIGNAQALAHVHHFVWDRTRAIRNDFSIQQVTKPDELRIAVECYERIARFHILSLHQLALPERPYSKYDWQQEREQLDRTLLSLIQYYEDSRGRIALPNEAEFRAYCVIFQLQDPTPDLEDRVQTWPREVIHDTRVQKALDVYMAACNTMDAQGPLKPRANHLIARQDWRHFWTLVASKEVSYLMACVAEIYFNLVRRTVLNALFRTTRANSTMATPDWTIDVLCELLTFDVGDEVVAYCERYGFRFMEREDGQSYLDLTSIAGRTLPEPNDGMPKQVKTSLVEEKRLGRTLSAVIVGSTVRQAQEAGMIVEDEDEGMEEDVAEDGNPHGMLNRSSDSVEDDGESLFIPESMKLSATTQVQAKTVAPLTSGLTGAADSSQPSIFAGGAADGFSFGKPSTPSILSQRQLVENTQTSQPSIFNFGQNTEKPNTPQSSIFNFTQQADKTQTSQPSSDRLKFDFSNAAWAPPTTTPAPKVDFTGNAGFGGFASAAAGLTGEASGAKQEEIQPTKFSLTTPSADQNGSSNPFPFSAQTRSSSPQLKTETKAETFQFALKAESKAPSPEQPNLSSQWSCHTQQAEAPAPTAPSIPTEAKVSQPHFTSTPTQQPPSPTQQPPSPTQQPASPLTASSGLRKPSVSADTRPKKPSPLSNSFTASEENGSVVVNGSTDAVSAKQPVQELFPGRHHQPQASATQKQQAGQAAPGDAAVSFEAQVIHLANQKWYKVGGLLEECVAYIVKKNIKKIKDEVQTERLNAEADDFRKFALHCKYGRRWRDLFWRRRQAKSGRERRQRRQRRLLEGSSQGQANDGSWYDGSSMRSSRAASIAEEVRSTREMVDSMFRQPADSGRWPDSSNELQAKAGSKRPASSHGANNSAPPRQMSHKRMKSTSHVDDRGRVTKPTTTSHPHADILKRSSFLGTSVSLDAASNRNTTNSNYFRLKAMGINRADDASGLSGMKRRRSESVQPESQTSPPALRSSMLGSRSEKSTTPAIMPPPPSAPSRASKTNDDDEALFARLKAARESLKQSQSYLQSEMAKEDEFRESQSSQSVTTESPSMVQARAEARWRASQAASPGNATPDPDRKVPAYRLRESRFVPREQYGRAIERAKEIRESRSRDSSRPESRLDQSNQEQKSSLSQGGMISIDLAQESTGQIRETVQPQTNGPNGVSHNTSPQAQPSPFQSGLASAVQPFSPYPSQCGPINFATHTTEMSSHNPFLQASTQNSFSTFGSHPAFVSKRTQWPANDDAAQDHTIQPEQIDQSLANSFGHSQSFAQDSTFQSAQHYGVPPPQPQEDSYLQSQAISLLSDDEDEGETPATYSNQELALANGTETDAATEEMLDDDATEDDQFGQMYGHANPYMALAHQGDTEEDEPVDWESQVEDDAESFGSDVDGEDQGEGPNGYVDDEVEDEDAVDGDIDQDEEEDEDGYGDEDEDDETQDTEEDSPPQSGHMRWNQGYNNSWNPAPPASGKNPPFQGVGGTVEEAIELSD